MSIITRLKIAVFPSVFYERVLGNAEHIAKRTPIFGAGFIVAREEIVQIIG